MVSERIMIAHFHGNLMTTITASYSPINVGEIEDIETFHEQLSASSRQIPKHDVYNCRRFQCTPRSTRWIQFEFTTIL